MSNADALVSLQAAFSQFARRARLAYAAIDSVMHKLVPDHKRAKCRRCNPRGNPQPLARGVIKGGKR